MRLATQMALVMVGLATLTVPAHQVVERPGGRTGCEGRPIGLTPYVRAVEGIGAFWLGSAQLPSSRRDPGVGDARG